MLNIQMTVHFTDGREVAVKAGPATQVAFERAHDCGITEIATSSKLSHIYWLAWHASKPSVGFAEWLELLESVDVEVSAADPTRPAAPADSSPN